MDFHLDDDLVVLGGLAREILADRATPVRLREIETSSSRADEDLWLQLAQAGLVGAAVPEQYGGAGLGLPGLVVVLQEQGRHVAPVPLWPAGLAGLVLAEHGSDEQRRSHLPGLAAGTSRMTVALEEAGGADPAVPTCSARRRGTAWRLDGDKAAVPTPVGAGHVLVSAGTPAGPGLFLIDADSDDVAWTYAHTTSHDRAGHLTLTDAVAEPVGEPGGPVLPWLLDRAAVAVSAVGLGVAEGALALAVTYTSGRQQFGRPLATFQSLAHQLADCSIDIDAMKVTLWQAVEALECGDGPPGAVLVARWWAARAGLDVVHRVQHVHGGIGVDVDYPVHRYFLWNKQLSGTLAGPSTTLEALGAVLASEQVRS